MEDKKENGSLFNKDYCFVCGFIEPRLVAESSAFY